MGTGRDNDDNGNINTRSIIWLWPLPRSLPPPLCSALWWPLGQHVVPMQQWAHQQPDDCQQGKERTRAHQTHNTTTRANFSKYSKRPPACKYLPHKRASSFEVAMVCMIVHHARNLLDTSIAQRSRCTTRGPGDAGISLSPFAHSQLPYSCHQEDAQRNVQHNTCRN